jgi:hypothetical protein
MPIFENLSSPAALFTAYPENRKGLTGSSGYFAPAGCRSKKHPEGCYPRRRRDGFFCFSAVLSRKSKKNPSRLQRELKPLGSRSDDFFSSTPVVLGSRKTKIVQ